MLPAFFTISTPPTILADYHIPLVHLPAVLQEDGVKVGDLWLVGGGRVTLVMGGTAGVKTVYNQRCQVDYITD